eukprot:1168561-Rhodomonas_salina.1
MATQGAAAGTGEFVCLFVWRGGAEMRKEGCEPRCDEVVVRQSNGACAASSDEVLSWSSCGARVWGRRSRAEN